MGDALLDVVISRIGETLGSQTKPTRNKLHKRVPMLLEFERILKQFQCNFIILKYQLLEKAMQVDQDELKRIEKIAYNVQKIVGDYSFFLWKVDILNIPDWNIFAKRCRDKKWNITAKELKDRIVKVPKIILKKYKQISRVLQTEDSGTLTEWLTDSTQGRAIISIWGTTTSGSKATLVKEVCETNEIRSNFDCYAWVNVAADCCSTGKKDFDIAQFLRKIAGQLMGGQRIDDDNLEPRIKACLNDKRYLVVLNDVEGKENWPFLDSILPQNNSGSKVVITTHSEDVASLADTSRILKRHSFNDLPPDLKNCALFCGLFPRNYVIKRKWVIGLWIAEGFVNRNSSNKTLEELSEDYINKLVEYSQIQVIEKDISERIKHFKAHDLSREIALRQKFGVVLDGSNIRDFGRDVPRVFVEKGHETFEFGATSSNVMSFISLDKDAPPPWNVKEKAPLSWIRHASTKFKQLRILCLRSAKIDVVPDDIYELYNLQYLDLASTNVKEIKSLVKDLKMLKTLDLRGTCVSSLPKEVKMLTNLRHLCVAPNVCSFSSVPVSGDICELIDLQTLKTIKAELDLVLHLRKLKMLKNLFITDVQRCFAGKLWDSLSNMPCLCTLGVVGVDGDALNLEEIIPLRNLEKLYLKGRLEEGVDQYGTMAVPSVFDRFGMLKDFRMVMSELRSDPLGSLSKMNGLLNLHLERAYNGDQLVFCDEWFPHLKKLHLFDMPQLSQIVINKGTMKNLKHLQLNQLINLKVPTGISYLQNLEDLILVNMPIKFIQTLNGSARASVQHIKNGITRIA